MAQELVLPDSTELSVHRTQTLGIQKAASSYEVGTDGIEVGEEMLRAIRDVEDSITTRKTEITRPLMQALASARDLFKPFELGLADAKKTVKAKILAYSIEQDEKARIEAEKVEKRVEKGTLKAETAAGKLEKIEEGKVKTNTRTLRKLSIVDETAIPREYMVVDREAVTKALFAGVDVPGAVLVEEKILITK
ncbi:MAG: siphovirus Gp157 family protein [Patescibacteria group bacterium]